MGIFNGHITSGDSYNLWSTAVAYSVNNVVIQNNRLYVCAIAHTSGTFATDLASGNWVSAAKAIGPQVTVYVSGSGTYTTPINATYLEVIVQGAGGSGASSGAGAVVGADGGNSTFGTLTGGGGLAAQAGQFAGASGGPATGGDLNIQGGVGQTVPGNVVPSTGQAYGGDGGNSSLGSGGVGGANPSAGGDAPANSGGGGGGAGTGAAAGVQGSAGGGAGGYVEKIIPNPVATYSYSIGVGGGGSIGGASGAAGGVGGDGYIRVVAYFS